MKKTLTILVIFALTFLLSIDSVKAQEVNTDLLFHGKKKYVIHGNVMSEIDKKGKLNTVIEIDKNVNDAIVSGNELWIATDKGVLIYDLNTMKQLRIEFPEYRIAGLAVDAEEKPWVATVFNGVYRQSGDGTFENKLNVITNYSIVATPDNNIYVGTNLGMYKLSLDGGNIIRYAEEAHSGHGLPDNLVLDLHADAESNIWVIMPDNISFKKSDNYVGEIPTFSFVGNKQNKLNKIIGLSNQSYLFVSEQGILILPSTSLKEHSHQAEVFSGHDTNAFQLSSQLLNAPADLLKEPVLYAEIKDNTIYFFTQKGVWKLTEKKLFKSLRKRSKAHNH